MKTPKLDMFGKNSKGYYLDYGLALRLLRHLWMGNLIRSSIALSGMGISPVTMYMWSARKDIG